MGVYTNIITELSGRLTANLTGETVTIGYSPDVLMQSDSKAILINIVDITEAYGRARQENHKDATLTVVLSCMIATVVGSKTYNDTVVPFIEDVLDAINTQSDGTTLNPQLVAGAESMGISVGNFSASDDRVWFEVTVTIRTVPFLINGRN